MPPRFSIPPDPYYEVMSGSDLNITCVAVGSPMPYVKWQKDKDDVLPEGSTPPIGKNVLELAGKDTDIRIGWVCKCIVRDEGKEGAQIARTNRMNFT